MDANSNWQFNFDEVDERCDTDLSETFYTNVPKEGRMISSLGRDNFDDGFITENPYEECLDYIGYDHVDEAQWNEGGYFSEEEYEFVRKFVYPLATCPVTGQVLFR